MFVVYPIALLAVYFGCREIWSATPRLPLLWRIVLLTLQVIAIGFGVAVAYFHEGNNMEVSFKGLLLTGVIMGVIVIFFRKRINFNDRTLGKWR